MAQPVIRVFPDLERLSREAAKQFMRLAQQQVQVSGRFSVALSGGSTPRRLYELLASEPYRNRIPWDQVHVFWADERCVPFDHPDSNFRQAFELLLSRVPLPPVNVYRIPADQGDPVSAAASYEQTLRAFFRLEPNSWPEFDLVLLGLGADGHMASLFPRSVALRETHRFVVATRGGAPDLPRVTLTIPVLNHATHLLWLVAGAEKSSVIRDVLTGPEHPDELPAEMIHPVRGNSMWLLDRAASSLLQRSPSHDPRR
ncbi:MAG: 6-phosphogluconolactonase [Candidatus Omnitrophica bacterium]|nr:6-phosphogluconolactonase [Candidatus Omnitrophota bacterium]